MSFPVLEKYLARLAGGPQTASSVWLDRQGRAQGPYFNATLLRLGKQTQQDILAQGFLWDLPAASLEASNIVGKPADLSAEPTSQAGAAA